MPKESRMEINRLFDKTGTRIGLYENIWPDTLQAWTVQGYPIAVDGSPADPTDVFGLDIGRLGNAFDAAPWPGRHILLEQTDEWEIVENSSGVTEKRWRAKSAPPGHLSFRLTDRDIWESTYKPAFEWTDETRIPAERLRADWNRHRAAGRWLCFNTSFVWENLRQTIGDVRLYENLLDDPEWIKEYNQTVLDFYIRHFERALDIVDVPDGTWISEDLAYNQGLFCSPAALRDLYLPYYSALIGYLHQKGMKVMLHSCGNILDILDDLVEIGLDVYQTVQPEIYDLKSLRDNYKNKLSFWGTISTQTMLPFETPDGVYNTIRDTVKLMGRGGGYICAPTHAVPFDVPPENIVAMVKAFNDIPSFY